MLMMQSIKALLFGEDPHLISYCAVDLTSQVVHKEISSRFNPSVAVPLYVFSSQKYRHMNPDFKETLLSCCQ